MMTKPNMRDFREVMAALTITATYLYIFMVTFIPIPPSSQRFADIILGSLLTLVIGKVLDHYFNNDRDIDKKDEPPS